MQHLDAEGLHLAIITETWLTFQIAKDEIEQAPYLLTQTKPNHKRGLALQVTR